MFRQNENSLKFIFWVKSSGLTFYQLKLDSEPRVSNGENMDAIIEKLCSWEEGLFRWEREISLIGTLGLHDETNPWVKL